MCTQSILLIYQVLLNFNFRFFLGTIEQIRVTNITNSSNIDLGTFQVPDKWNAREHRLHFNFSHVSFYYIRSSRKWWERLQEGAYTCWDPPPSLVNVAADISLSLYIYKVIRKGWDFRNEPTESISCTLGLTQLFLIVDYIFKTVSNRWLYI